MIWLQLYSGPESSHTWRMWTHILQVSKCIYVLIMASGSEIFMALGWKFSGIHFLSNLCVCDMKNLKGLGHDWWSLFTISFYPKLLYVSNMKSSFNRTTIFKLIVHRIELHVAFEERGNKQKKAKFSFKNLELSFFSHKIVLVMQFCGKRKITLNYAIFININGSWQCLQIKTFMSDF